MDTSLHTLCTLFAQLGLPDNPADIRAFIASHPLPADTAIADAPFWNAAQAAFLKQALDDDADWAELVDTLAARLQQG
ncbi:MAG: DUF2789 domain-containing protein [Vogesella sp.]|nr:DUF2789 domain-containing protein [Vogesella sp.]